MTERDTRSSRVFVFKSLLHFFVCGSKRQEPIAGKIRREGINYSETLSPVGFWIQLSGRTDLMCHLGKASRLKSRGLKPDLRSAYIFIDRNFAEQCA
jgi:hypothetical protein